MSSQKDIDRKYKDLMESYINIKPILSNLYMRNGNHHVDGILNEIRALNDHIARCYRAEMNEGRIYEELCKAEGHLKRLIYDCFKQLNIIFYDYATEYEKKYFGPHWICLDHGHFWKEYTGMRQAVVKSVEDAKMNESQDSETAFNNYQDAYVIQERIYELLDLNKSRLEWNLWQKLVNVVKTNRSWFCATVVLTLLCAVMWELMLRLI